MHMLNKPIHNEASNKVEAYAMLEAAQEDEDEAGDDTPEEPTESTASDVEGEDPTAATPPHETHEGESDGGSSDTPEDCPRCGAELVDVRGTNYLRHESGRDVEIPEQWDYVCSDWCERGASGFEVSG